MIHKVNLDINCNSRKEIRKEVVTIFLEEAPGNGKGKLSSKYIYYVERINDGRRIFLKRPANLNKGFDFTVHVESTNFGNKNSTDKPSHKSILSDLAEKKDKNYNEFKKAWTLVERLFNCETIDDSEYINFQFETGHHIEIILKSIKWLFIEQDITYWNYSGRYMLYNALKNL